MNGAWPVKTLEEVCENLDGKRVPITQSQRTAGDVPYYGASGVVDHVADFLFNEELLLVSEDGANLLARTYPIAFSISGKSWVNNHAHVLRFQDRASQRFAEYYLNSITLVPYVSGMAQPKLNQRQLNSIPLPFPPLPEQKRIVAILDEAFEGIDKAVANAEKNLANARELFESYLNSVFTQRGEGWVEATIGAACSIKSGTTVSKNLEQSAAEIPYLKVADMTYPGNEATIVTSSRFLRARDVREANILPPGTTIFPKRGGAIMTNKKRLVAVPICADLNIMGVIPSADLDPRFLYFYFLGVDMKKLGGGSSIPQINNYDIDPLPIAFPPDRKEQERIAEQLDAFSHDASQLEATYDRKLNCLAGLRQSILHKAFTGELTAKPERAMREAAL